MSNLKNLISALCTEQIQDLEDKARELLFRLDIDNSEGTQLDGIGEIVGQSRLGYSDELYRVLIKIRIGINVSEGDVERILTVWKMLTNTTDVKLIESYPASIRLTTTTYIGDEIGNLLMDLFQDVIPAGVRLELIQIWDTDRFGWSGDYGNWGVSNWITEYCI
jgi:hypothetical protein